MSFGLGVAVQHSRYFVPANIAMSFVRVLPSMDFKMLELWTRCPFTE